MRSSTSCIRWAIIVVVVSLTSFSSPAAAGQGSGASIIGQVTDQSGAVLPGVTVTATSPALQVPQVTDVTNELGEYRLAPLPIGVYEVAFDLSGFRAAQRQNVRLTVGFTARIDVSLGLATVAESITVAGAAPVVDVASTSGSTLFTQEVLQGHSDIPKFAYQPVEPGARRAQHSRCRWKSDRGEPVGSCVRAERPGVVHDRGGFDDPHGCRRGRWQLLGLPDARRGARPEPRNRCGVSDARCSD